MTELNERLAGATPATRTKVEKYAAFVLEQESTLRTEQEKFRLTPQEKKVFLRRAKAANLSKTEFFVKMCCTEEE